MNPHALLPGLEGLLQDSLGPWWLLRDEAAETMTSNLQSLPEQIKAVCTELMQEVDAPWGEEPDLEWLARLSRRLSYRCQDEVKLTTRMAQYTLVKQLTNGLPRLLQPANTLDVLLSGAKHNSNLHESLQARRQVLLTHLKAESPPTEHLCDASALERALLMPLETSLRAFHKEEGIQFLWQSGAGEVQKALHALVEKHMSHDFLRVQALFHVENFFYRELALFDQQLEPLITTKP